MLSPGFAQAIYVGLFGGTIVACIGGLVRTRLLEPGDTRRGLRALLLLSALWAAGQIVHLLGPGTWLGTASYRGGLVVGLATVGAWLYFCSAYAGRSYHRKPLYRRLAVVVYVPIVAFKLTNPWHGLYFDTATVMIPFRHTAIQEQSVFWVVAGLAYVLSAFGFYMLLDVFEETRATSRSAGAIVALAALPVVFNVVGYLLPRPVLSLNYESVGVGLFAIGALFVVREPFFAVSRYGRAQLIDSVDDAVFILDANGRVRDYNSVALDLFPELADEDRPQVAEVSRDISTRVLSDGGAVELERDGETRYFTIRTAPITVGATEVGEGIVCTDVTEIEQQRRRLERKDEQLEGFAAAITHELRNSVGTVSGHAELLARTASESESPEVRARAETIVDEAADMERIVEELQTLARYSQTISETTVTDIGKAARSAKRQADADALGLGVERSVELRANQERLHELLRNMFVFAVQNGASNVTVRGRHDGFTVEGDGLPLAEFDEADVFAYGNAVPDSDTAMTLPNVKTLATSHGWEVTIDSEYTEGGRIRISGVDTK